MSGSEGFKKGGKDQKIYGCVCEKNNIKPFNFDNDAIKPRVADSWVKTNGTTPGTDYVKEIGASLAVFTSNK